MIPDAYYKDIYKINYKKLKNNGIKNIFFDVDNTLIPYRETNVNNELKELFSELKKDFNIFIFSNGNSDRVKKIQKDLDIGGYYTCMKPLKKNYKKVLTEYKKDECVFIGDQFMTDVLGAKRNNLKVILVDVIDKSYEPLTTKFWRILENIHLNKLNRKELFKKFNYYDIIK